MPVFALVDCNNFYASCERVFNPALEGKPILVLSNNDGCIIARSNEVKTLGIPMGGPFYKWRDFCEKNGVFVFSSNYALYGDMSYRVMATLKDFCPTLEIYSIDEAFLDLESFQGKDIIAHAALIRKKVKMWTGMPVSIGMGPTKTLAKIANYLAKKTTSTGVFDLSDEVLREKYLADCPVSSVWGIGRRISRKLENMKIHSAKDLRDADLKIMRRNFSVVVEKTIRELRGVSCLPLEDVQPRKQIMSSRSFNRAVTVLSELEEAVSHYTAKACIKLRAQRSLANGVYVYIHTSLFNEKQPSYGNGASLSFAEPLDDSTQIISVALHCLRSIYKSGYRYSKAGIMLLDVVPNTLKQFDLLSFDDNGKSDRIMKMLDGINKKLGKGSIFICAEGIERPWHMKSGHRSPRYTTQWSELPTVFCK
jgi:DNA polymerase V